LSSFRRAFYSSVARPAAIFFGVSGSRHRRRTKPSPAAVRDPARS
jgi:hypothetical protein